MHFTFKQYKCIQIYSLHTHIHYKLTINILYTIIIQIFLIRCVCVCSFLRSMTALLDPAEMEERERRRSKQQDQLVRRRRRGEREEGHQEVLML